LDGDLQATLIKLRPYIWLVLNQRKRGKAIKDLFKAFMTEDERHQAAKGEGTPKNLPWSDGRMRALYGENV